ncbi:photosystem I subunit XII (PsaM) [Prochlorococcus marinus str. SS51]|nr:photosystem I subunit XII (PsaM) [Prochlorococcus marinus str. SS2]KGG23173.1 photosystem I subunit XII (PsaM) [Prochlorococcus marinus str. SS35]KGG33884.1 photosystem I subunit XII (PsaM) [Prochlorococcus marinus str. SS51]
MIFMETSTTIDLAGLCLVVVMHAGILALRLGISLKRA